MDLPFPEGIHRMAPMPDTLEAAREEIVRLRAALVTDRAKLAKMAERRVGDNKAAAGTQRVLREKIAILEAFKAVHGGEACLEERAAGNGPCGACSVCVKELKDKVEDLLASIHCSYETGTFGPIEDAYSQHAGKVLGSHRATDSVTLKEVLDLRAELARWKIEENEDGSPADSDCTHPELCGFCRARAHRLQVLGLRLDNLKKYVTEMPCSEDCEPEDGWCECVREPLLSMIEKGHP